MSDQPPKTLNPRARLLLTIGVIALGIAISAYRQNPVATRARRGRRPVRRDRRGGAENTAT